MHEMYCSLGYLIDVRVFVLFFMFTIRIQAQAYTK